MIKLFVLDVDGCISEPFKTPDWETITRIRDLNRDSRSKRDIPPVTLCTGRPLPYAEAVAQWLDVDLPYVFESAGLFDPDQNRVVTAYETGENGRPGDEKLNSLRQFRNWLTVHLIPKYPNLMLEFYKMMDAGIVSHDKDQVDRAYQKIIEKVESDYPDLEVHRTDVSVNTLLSGNNKGKGIELLSRKTGLALDEIAYIGDSEGDIPALKQVEMAFAPDNAVDSVKKVAEVIDAKSSRAVLMAYEIIIQKNSEFGDSGS